ncbi:MAG: AAA family ATPase [Actinomycetota bacterium]
MVALSEPVVPFVVVISGVPGAGKTTLGWQLSRRLHVPFVSRDDIKTGLHVTHRSNDPDEAWRFAEHAFDTFFETISVMVRNGVSLVAEAAFHANRAHAPITALANSCELIHIPLTTPDNVAVERYVERAQARPRHPSHNDRRFGEEMRDGTKSVEVYRLALPCPTLSVDGSDQWDPSIDEIVSFIRSTHTGHPLPDR